MNSTPKLWKLNPNATCSTCPFWMMLKWDKSLSSENTKYCHQNSFSKGMMTLEEEWCKDHPDILVK